jgi:hypothetical protein
MRIILIIFCFISIQVYSQDSFSYRLESVENEILNCQGEIEQGEFWIGYTKAGLNNKVEDYKGYLLKIQGSDTSTIFLNRGDTIRQLKDFIKTSDNHFLLICAQWSPPDFNLALNISLVDSLLNDYWSVEHYFPDSTQFISRTNVLTKNNIDYYIIGSITKQYNSSINFLCKVNVLGNILSLQLRDNPSPMGISNTCFSADSNYFLSFGYDFGMISCVKTDTNYQVISITPLPGNEITSVFVPVMGRVIKNDSIIFIGNYLRALTYPQNQDIGISILDSLLTNTSPILYSGEIDTIDWPAELRCLDFLSKEKIFYGGTKNIDPMYYSGEISWIIIGQCDQLLQKKFEYVYGGDAYYYANFINATTDGGCLVSVIKYYPTILQSDIWVFKLNDLGLFTGMNERLIEQNEFLVYYSSMTNRIYIQKQNLNYYKFSLFDINGKLLFSKPINNSTEEFGIAELSKGIYIYKIESKYHELQKSGKLLIQ